MLPTFFLFACFIAGVCGTINLPIGGLFDLYNSTHIDDENLQYFSAFLMAINEINNKTDGIWDDLLPGVHLDVVVRNAENTRAHAAAAATEIIRYSEENDNSLRSVVNTLNNNLILNTNDLFSDSDFVQAIGVASETTLGFGSMSPYRISTVPLESFQGMTTQEMWCTFFEYERVVIFSELSLFGQMGSIESTDFTYCDVYAMVTISFAVGITDFTPYIDRAKEVGGTVYLLISDPDSVGMIIEQGYELGLFHNSQLFVMERSLSPVMWEVMKPTTNVTEVMDGVIGVQFYPEYERVTAAGQEFITRWRAQPSTVGAGVGSCVSGTDVTPDAFPLYETKTGECMGLDFSSFPQDGSTLAPYVMNVYDSVYALALGYNNSLTHGTLSAINTDVDVLARGIIDNVTFNGASGYIDIFEGMDSFGGYARGSREEGFHFKVRQFDASMYAANPLDSFAYVAIWSPENTTYLCGNDAAYPGCVDFHPKAAADGKAITSRPPYYYESMPDVVKVGLLIRPLFEDNIADIESAADMGTLKMALDNFNHKSDGIWDDYLPNTKVVIAVETATDVVSASDAAQNLVEKPFGGTSVDFVIVTFHDTDMVMAAVNILESHEVVVLVTDCASSHLSTINAYDNVVQLLPSDSYSGSIFQHMVANYFEYSKVVIISVASPFGSQAVDAFRSGEYGVFDVMGVVTIAVAGGDIRGALGTVMNTGAKVFVLFLPPDLSAAVIEAGYDMGLLGDETQILLYEETEHDIQDVFEHFSPSSDVAQLMKGVITLEYYGDYYLQGHGNYQPSQVFKDMFYEMPSMMYEDGSCSNEMDDAELFYLYHEPLVSGMKTSEAACNALNFSAFKDGTLKLHENIPILYDTIHLIQHGLRDCMNSSNPAPHAKTIVEAMMNMDGFDGSAGFLDISGGDPLNFGFGAKMRHSDVVYKVKIFREETYTASNHTVGFVTIGSWSLVDGVVDCTSASDDGCYIPTYNNRDPQRFPPDMPPIIHNHISVGVVAIVVVFGIIIVGSSVFGLAFLQYYRKEKIIKSAQPQMLNLVLVGSFFIAARCFLIVVDVTDDICIANIWLGHGAFWLIISVLVLKSWRIHRIVNNKTLKSVRIPVKNVLMKTAVIMSVLVVYLLIFTFVGQPHAFYSKEVIENQRYYSPGCTAEIPIFETLLFIAEAVYLIYGIYLTYLTKDVPGALNDSKSVADAIILIVVLSGLAFPVIYVFGLDIIVQQTIAALTITIATIAVILLMFAPKVMFILEGDEVDDNLQIVKHSSSFGNVKIEDHDKSEKGGYGHNNAKAGDLIVAGNIAGGLSTTEKMRLAQDQIELWKAALLQIADHDSHGSSNQSSACLSQNDDAIPVSEEKNKTKDRSASDGKVVPFSV